MSKNNLHQPFKCQKCSHTSFDIINTETTTDAIRRRRSCNNCGHRVTTYERMGLHPLASMEIEQVELIMKHLRIASGNLISISDLLPPISVQEKHKQ